VERGKALRLVELKNRLASDIVLAIEEQGINHYRTVGSVIAEISQIEASIKKLSYWHAEICQN